MVAAAGPAVGDGLAGRAAIDIHHDRIAPGRIETGRLDHAVVQLGGSVGCLEGAELDRALGVQVTRVGVLRIGQVVVDQRGDFLAVGAVQRDLRRGGGVGPAVHVHAGVARETGAVHARRLRQALRCTALQRHRVDLAFARGIDPGAEIRLAGRLVHGQQFVHRPGPLGQRGDGLAVIGNAVQVLKAGALGRPDETALGEEAQAVVQRHPGGGGFTDQGLLAAAGQVGLDQFQVLLVARLALEGEALRIAPIHPCQVDVRVAAQVDPARRGAGLRGDHAQLHGDVVVAGGRVTLLDHLGAIGVHLIALLHRHRAFIDAGKGDCRVVRRPPVAGVAVHLLVGDELGHAIADGVAAIAGKLDLPAAGQVDHPQVARPHEADEAALGRQLGIGGKAFAVGELAYRGAALLAQVVQVQLAAKREQQRARVRRPLVIHDAGHGGDALAFPARLFLVAQRLQARQHHLGIDQQPGLATGDVIAPQIQLVAVGLLAAQETHLGPVRSHLGLHQGRAGQRQRTGDGLQGEFFGVGDRGRGEHEGKRSKQVAHEGFRQRLGVLRRQGAAVSTSS
ncbi:hypothetical protein D3C86_660790 [compost metagenome]